MRRLIAPLLLVTLASCAPTSDTLRQKAGALAGSVGMHEAVIPTSAFPLLTFERISDPQAPVRIYIEGDGNAWLTRNQVSPDPTPLDPTALKLAVRDTSPNVAYLARPCQYLPSSQCQPQYWTSAQFSEPLIASFNEAMNHWGGHKLELVGYSGGGAVAMLTAARRQDIASIRTVAGNIDTAAFTAFHKVSPLSDSLNPAAYKDRTAAIPQIHFAGEKDRVVPSSLAENYQRSLPANNCSAYVIVPGADHHSGWIDQWPSLLAHSLPCTR